MTKDSVETAPPSDGLVATAAATSNNITTAQTSSLNTSTSTTTSTTTISSGGRGGDQSRPSILICVGKFDNGQSDDSVIIIDSSSDESENEMLISKEALNFSNKRRKRRSNADKREFFSRRGQTDPNVSSITIDADADANANANGKIDSVAKADDTRILMEVTGLQLNEAIALENKYSNLQEAITAYFEHANDNASITRKESSADETLALALQLQLQQPIDNASKSANITGMAVAAQAIAIPMLHRPSQKWIDIVHRCKQLNVQFVDQEFPPNKSSLDGRRVVPLPSNKTEPIDSTASSNSNSTSAQANPTVIKCRCGLPAAVKTVQKDGPNYGRFFLACGKPRPRKKKVSAPKRKADNSDNEIIVIDGKQEHDSANANKEKEKEEQAKAVSKEMAKELAAKQCQFFQWDDNHTQSETEGLRNQSLMHKLNWFRFDDTRHGYYLTHPNGNFRPDHVMQGAMGDCWFLSALAVVAEKEYLIHKLFPHQEFNDTGCYEVNFCLDGRWSSILVDSLLPAIARASTASTNNKGAQKQQKPNSRRGVQIADGITVQPAFAAGNVSWPAIVEKAYAKVHGSYSRLSGGFISEAFYDLTGAPIERMYFRKEFDVDQLFARLLSFVSAGFLMGIATSAGGDGLVACHAYSLLGVYEIHDVVVGEQKKVTNFFKKKDDHDDEVMIVEPPPSESRLIGLMRETVRLVRIRNPWGVREWKGTWSASSDQWTEKIRRQLGNEVCKQGDGTFFMSFDDMIKRFDHMDVAKCQEDWKRTARGGAVKLHETGDPLLSCTLVYQCIVKERTWGFISIVQRKKRANATTQFWYTDFSIMALKRKHGDDRWELVQCVLQGVERTCDCELFLDPDFEYCFLPFSYLSGREEMEFGAQIEKKKSAPFQFTTYSANEVIVKAQVRSSLGRRLPIELLHSSLVSSEKKISHTLGPRTVLLAINGDGCVYFLVLNAGDTGFVLNLKIDLNRGIHIAYGSNNDTYSIPPKAQCIILVLTNDGRQVSPCVNFKFKTDCSNQKVSSETTRNATTYAYSSIGSRASLSLAGEAICRRVESGESYRCGEGTLDERLWNTVM